ncbi:hypothetical protein A0H81_10163 [Grifola frondosa]|uniref:Uncharacterized protein n=1 Tax=Grifola frondosa TaxID=5627 RepID=A0A1C7LZ79_GRIFR|nr:hypothetical protein A0H81_10163 [Grifola frondosa]
MLFRSSLDPTVQSKEQLIVLCHAEERILIPLPQTYEEMQEVARREFALTGDIVIETDDVQGCEGTRVTVHKDSWNGISPVLKSVTAKAVKGKAPASRLSGALNYQSVPAQPAGSWRLMDDTAFRSGTFGTTQSGAESPQTAQPAVSRRRIDDTAFITRTIGLKQSSADFLGIERPTSPELTWVVSSVGSFERPSAKKAAAPLEHEGDSEEEVPIPSPSKRRATRHRILSDYGDNSREGGGDVVGDKARDVKPQVSSTSSSPSTSDGRQRGESSAIAHQGIGIKQEKVVKVKTENVSPSRIASSPESKINGSPEIFDDGSFLISVEYPESGETCWFKTRGHHLVSKVLTRACRTFKIEQASSRARLLLVIDEDIDGERVDGCAVCSPRDSMDRLGAKPHSKFLLELME